MCRELQGLAVTSAYLPHCRAGGQRLSVGGEGQLCSNSPGIPGWEEEKGYMCWVKEQMISVSWLKGVISTRMCISFECTCYFSANWKHHHYCDDYVCFCFCSARVSLMLQLRCAASSLWKTLQGKITHQPVVRHKHSQHDLLKLGLQVNTNTFSALSLRSPSLSRYRQDQNPPTDSYEWFPKTGFSHSFTDLSSKWLGD